jgi:putative ABC transport system ATP-binding protein
MIELKDIHKAFNSGRENEFHALKGIDLHLPAQRVTAFRGPSGSGKTTLLSIIGCLSRPTSGRVRLGERDISGLPERFLTDIRRQTFGFIFQQFNLIKGLSAQENVMLPAYPLGGHWRTLHERAERLLGDLRLSHRRAAAVEHLSGGEQQRVAIARALINDPPDHHRRRTDGQSRQRSGDRIHGHPGKAARPRQDGDPDQPRPAGRRFGDRSSGDRPARRSHRATVARGE